MSHFVGYHKADEWGPYFEEARRNRSASLDFFTGKPYRADTLIDGRLWIFTGRGRLPTQYELVCSGIMRSITRVERPAQYRRPGRGEGTNIAFDVDYLPEPIDVSNTGWFQRLLAEQQNFSRGLSRISDEGIIAELTKIRAEEH
jgi:hypothetical protein